MRCYLPDYCRSLLSNLPAPSCSSVVSSPPSNTGDWFSGEVRPCSLLYSKPSQGLPPHRVTTNPPTTACKTLHNVRQRILIRTRLPHPPLVHSAPATWGTLFLRHAGSCLRAFACAVLAVWKVPPQYPHGSLPPFLQFFSQMSTSQ